MGMDRQIEKKKWPRKRVVKYIVVAAVVLVAGYMLLFNHGGSTLNVARERVTVSTVKKGPFQEFIPIRGSVMPRNSVHLDAVVGGRVDQRFVEAGAVVEKGDKILQLTNTNLLMTLLNNEAQVSRASNDLRMSRLQLEQNRLALKSQRTEADHFLLNAKQKFERYKVLIKENLIAQQDFDAAKNDYNYWKQKQSLTVESQDKDLLFREQQVTQLERSVDRMKESLRLLQRQMDQLTVRAPISGQLTSLTALVGESKNQGERLGQIDEVEGFKVRAGIDEHYLNRIEEGRVGTFDLNGQPLVLTVEKIYPEVKDGEFLVDLAFKDKEPAGIRRGQTLHIRLQLGKEEEALLLARGGFYSDTGGRWVYVLDPSGNTAVKRNIRIGRQNPRYFELLEGLKPGEQVITSAYQHFGDAGQLVLK